MKFTLVATFLAASLPLSVASGGDCQCEGFEYIDFVEAPILGGRRLESGVGQNDDSKLRATSPDDEKHRELRPGRGPPLIIPEGPLTPPQWFSLVTNGFFTPFANCILAPVESEEDLTAIRDARDGSGLNFLEDLSTEDIVVGVYKDPAEAAECVDEDVENCRSNWQNFDGSDVPSSDDIWAGARRPNDSGNFAVLTAGGRNTQLDSVLSTDEFAYAAVKCCLTGPVCYDTGLPFGPGGPPGPF